MSDARLESLGGMTRLKHVSTVQTGVTLSGEGDLADPEWPYLRVANVQVGYVDLSEIKTVRVSLDKAAASMLRPGDVLMTEGGDIDKLGRGALWRGELPDMLHQNHIFAVRPDEVLDSEFLVYWLDGLMARTYFRTTAKQTTNLAGTNKWTLGNLPLPVPPLNEQRRTIAYLDRETARIDTLIEEQHRLIEMLRERRWAVIERAVALLDWDTPFKAVASLIQTGPFGSQLKSDEYEDDGIPVINPSHIIAGEVVPDPRIAVSSEKAAELARHTLEEEDLIAARRGDLGRCAVVGPSAAGFLCGTGSALVRLDRARMEPLFAATVFSSRRNRDALSLASVGSTMDNLNSDIIGALRIPVPSLDEQRQLTAELKQATARIDTLIAEAERFIELSTERRAALITAAVTGQIDVREMV